MKDISSRLISLEFFQILLCAFGVLFLTNVLASSQEKFELELCEAATDRRVVELVYDADKSKGCEPRIVDVHQVALGKNGKLYMHGYQHRGCAKKNDRPAERTFRFDKIKSVRLVEGDFTGKSPTVKEKGWSGCLGNNCFIEKNICE